LQSNNIGWDAVVKVSTAHYVFPALYCNMQRANFFTLFTKSRLNILYKAAVYKKYRVWLFKRVSDKSWQKEKLIQLGFKK
jgi:hypothetical protein